MKKSEKIIIELARRGCLTLEEIKKRTGIDDEDLILVYMTRYYKRGLIYRRWRKFGGKKYREYCLEKD